MADPLDTAVEELAPRPATTNFFGPGSSQESVLSRYANSRTTLDSARELGQSASRLGQSRWDRVARQRQQKLWGREDEDYQAKKDFDAKRGEFLGAIARIDETADDFEDSLNELIATAPEEALKDDAVRSILGYKQRVAGELRQQRDMEAREARYQKRDERQGLQTVATRAAEVGVPAERIRELVDQGDIYGLAYEAGRREREAQVKPAPAMKLTEYGTRGQKLLADTRTFPRGTLAQEAAAARNLTVEEFNEKHPREFKDVDDLDNNVWEVTAPRIAAMTESAYVNEVGNLSPEQRRKRSEVWRLARAEQEALIGSERQPAIGDVPAAQDRRGAVAEMRARGTGMAPLRQFEDAPEVAAPAAPAPSVPTVVRGGVTYKLVDGEWVIE